MEEKLGTEWLVEQLRNGKELNDELIQEAKEIENKNKAERQVNKVAIKDYEENVHLLLIALSLTGIQIDYPTADLVYSCLKRFNKLKGKMAISDGVEIKIEHQKKWDLYFKQKEENKEE
jgi:hypothetical protein